MPRIRSIKPGFFANEGLSVVSELAQILAGGLICYADDEGYFEANPLLIKAAVFPLRRTVQEDAIVETCKELFGIGYVRFGNGPDGKRYGHVVNFKEHQKVSHAIPSKIKGMQIVWEVSRKAPEDSVRTPEVLRPELNRIELNRIEGKEPSNQKPSARKARGPQQTDIRFHHFIEILHRYWDRFSKPKIRFELWFDAPGGKQLKNILKRHEAFTVEEFTHCVANRARSPGVKHEEPFYLWGGHILEWVGGPKGNGQASKDAERNARNKAEIIRGITGQSPSGDAFHSGPAVPERDNSGSDRVLEVESHRSRAAIAGTDT